MPDLLDVNVWVALSAIHHTQHNAAAAYWAARASRQVVMCRTTSLGLVRILSQPKAFGKYALSPADAWSVYENWLRSPYLIVEPEPHGIDSLLGAWSIQGLTTSRNWTDAYLAAFARSGNHRLVSFDADFSRFAGLDFLQLA